MSFPIIRSVKWLHANVVRIILKDGRVFDRALPIPSARKAHVVGRGTGIDIGDGRDGDSMWAIHGAKFVGILKPRARKIVAAASP